MNEGDKIVIVGGGLAGLACAVRLHESGKRIVLLESSSELGGRVQSKVKKGFILDRGFQVFLSAYPEAAKFLDLEALDLKAFRPGALIFRDGGLHRLMDVFRCPQYALSTPFQPIGNLWDKLLVGKLRLQALIPLKKSRRRDTSTESYLRSYGFSERMIDGFFRAFYGGIFLERDLRTSSRMFEFTFRMFAKGNATIPSKGMQEIPRQLAARLPPEAIRTNATVDSIESSRIALSDGNTIHADRVVVATDVESAARIVPGLTSEPVPWRSVTGLYYSAPQSPLKEAIIALNGEANGLVNNVCALSDVAPSYAPNGRALISVSVLGLHHGDQLEDAVLRELQQWFGEQVQLWEHLHTDQIRRALPEQGPHMGHTVKNAFRCHDGLLICGGPLHQCLDRGGLGFRSSHRWVYHQRKLGREALVTHPPESIYPHETRPAFGSPFPKNAVLFGLS